jgi:hypothetical protein
MTSLDSLTTFGSELTAEQLDDVDGGMIWVLPFPSPSPFPNPFPWPLPWPQCDPFPVYY